MKDKLKKRQMGMSCLRGALPERTLKMISEGWFQSVMVYCLPLYGGCAQTELDDLQIIQNKLARMVTGSNQRTHRADMFYQLRWFTVRQLVMYHTLITVFTVGTIAE